jgi:hypothetical protein
VADCELCVSWFLLASQTEARIFFCMGYKFVGTVHIVVATKDYQTEYWAAATRREEAVSAVQQKLAPGWTVRLTERTITPEQIGALKLLPNSVRKLKYAP